MGLGARAVAVILTVAAAGSVTGVSLAAASSTNGNGNGNAAGNGGSSAGAPPQPVIGTSNLPSSPTNATSASFTYTDSRPAVTFLCSLDTSTFASCPSSGITYSKLANATHTFRVEAQNGKGPVSIAASFSWTVANQQFPISGSLSTPLAPGVPPQSLNLSITNPYSFNMKVTAVGVAVASTSNPTKCPVAKNFQTTNYTGTGFTVAAGATETMTAAGVPTSQLPTIQMIDLPTTNQDGCRGVTLNLTYSGAVTTP